MLNPFRVARFARKSLPDLLESAKKHGSIRVNTNRLDFRKPHDRFPQAVVGSIQLSSTSQPLANQGVVSFLGIPSLVGYWLTLASARHLHHFSPAIPCVIYFLQVGHNQPELVQAEISHGCFAGNAAVRQQLSLNGLRLANANQSSRQAGS